MRRAASWPRASTPPPETNAAAPGWLPCLLDEQPGYLAPRTHSLVMPPASRRDDLIVNPFYRRVSSGKDTVTAAGARRQALWVVDPVTGVGTPCAVGPVLAPLVRALRRGKPVPRCIAAADAQILLRVGILLSRADLAARHHAWRKMRARLRREFARRGYVRLTGLLHPFYMGELRLHYRRLMRSGRVPFGDPQVPHRYGVHNEPVARSVHRQLTALVADLAGEPVQPSYAYVAGYQAGAELPEHVDREQCEISMSLLVDYTPEVHGPSPWPLCLRAGGVVRIFQKIGDALLYRGRMLPHFRDRLADGASSTSLLLHYVPRAFHGPLD